MRAAAIQALVDDRPEDGVFSVHQRVFTDQDVFDLEMRHIFESTWNFLGFASSVAKPHDFFTTRIGKKSILVTRDSKGSIGAFFNRCRHKGAKLCQESQGNTRVFVCPYHAWSFDSAGRSVGIKERSAAAYSESFEGQDHGLEPLAKVANYKGLVFGSLNPDVPPLEEHLGEMKLFLDIVLEQGPNGMEAIPGRSIFTFRANWKMQLENGLDSYHLTATHSTFVEVMTRRRSGGGNPDAKSLDWAKSLDTSASTFTFENGHSALVVDYGPEDARPFIDLEEIRGRLPKAQADIMHLTFNSLFFPNMQIVQNTAMALRQFHPISPGLTEIHYYCFGAIGEPPEQRAMRLRAFEDFYNASGLASPDDSVIYELCQQGFNAGEDPWLQGYARGARLKTAGANERARELGLRPLESASGRLTTGNEMGLHGPYRHWRDTLSRALMREELAAE